LRDKRCSRVEALPASRRLIRGDASANSGERMTKQIESSIVSYSAESGKIEGYLAKPGTGTPRPAIIAIHEIFGLDEHIKDVTNRIAAQGYVTLAPDLYSGSEALRSTLTKTNVAAVKEFMQMLPPGKMRDTAIVQQELAKQSEEKRASLQKVMSLLFGGLPKSQMTQDLVKAVDYLNSQAYVKKGAIGSVGFCFGGGMSINLACHARTAACVIFYGENPSPIDLLKNLNGPLLGLYGGDDIRINSNLDQLVRAIVEYKKDLEMRIYPGAPHAFFNDTSKATYRPDAARDSWDKMLRFFARTL